MSTQLNNIYHKGIVVLRHFNTEILRLFPSQGTLTSNNYILNPTMYNYCILTSTIDEIVHISTFNLQAGYICKV